jgi:hypothetical protein
MKQQHGKYRKWKININQSDRCAAQVALRPRDILYWRAALRWHQGFVVTAVSYWKISMTIWILRILLAPLLQTCTYTKNDSFNLLLLILVYLITLFAAFHSTLLRICHVFSMFHELFCTMSILSRDDRISRQYRFPLPESSAIWVEQLVRKSELCQVTWGPKDSVKWKGAGLKGRNPDIYRLISGLWFMS